MARVWGIVIILFLTSLGVAFAASQQEYDACSQMNDVDRSREACEHIANDQREKAVDRAAAYISLGNIYLAAGDPRSALLYAYFPAMRLRSKTIYLNAGLAIAYWRLGKRKEAIESYRSGLQLDPKGFAELVSANEELKAIVAAQFVPGGWGVIVAATVADQRQGLGQVYVGMKFGADTQDEAESQAISRCLAQCRELLSPSYSCAARCSLDGPGTQFKRFGPGECGYVTIGTSPPPLAFSMAHLGETKEEALRLCHLSLDAVCDQEPVGGCNKSLN